MGFGRLLLLPIENRNQNTLSTIIENFVSKNCTMIATDSWKGYSNLKDLGYQHYKVNHSKNFVAPKFHPQKQIINLSNKYNSNNNSYTRHLIHTQGIENKWMHIKSRLQLLKGQRKHFYSDILQSLFYLTYREILEQKSIEVLKMYYDKFKNIKEKDMVEEEINNTEEDQDQEHLELSMSFGCSEEDDEDQCEYEHESEENEIFNTQMDIEE
ncbi:hypothetical protein ABPG72_018579 [Tetrahymena utriculariae]